MRRSVVWLCVGILIGALLSAPVSAQLATRVFGTLSTDLTTGASTPVLCTANGTGCYLQVILH